MLENMRTYLRVGDVACASRDHRTLGLVAAWLTPHLPGQIGGLSFTIAEMLSDGMNEQAFGAWRYLRTALRTLVERGDYAQAAL